MRRIPAVATIRDAYGFAATHLGGIIGLIWVPMLLATTAQFFTLHRFYNDSIDFLAGGNAAQMGPTLLMTLACLVATLLLYAVMFVAVAQLALGTRAVPAFIHFAFGPLEWRMFRAFFAFVGLMLLTGLSILLTANTILALAPGAKMGQDAVGSVMVLAMIFLGLALTARFLLLLPAIAVNETAPALRRAWMLSAGNFLPLLGVLLAVFLPVKLVQIFIELGLGEKYALVAGATPQLQMIATIVHARQMLPLACGLSFFISPLAIGLLAGASVSAWRALKDEPTTEILA